MGNSIEAKLVSKEGKFILDFRDARHFEAWKKQFLNRVVYLDTGFVVDSKLYSSVEDYDNQESMPFTDNPTFTADIDWNEVIGLKAIQELADKMLNIDPKEFEVDVPKNEYIFNKEAWDDFPSGGFVGTPFPRNVAKGWECPRCGSVYAPFVRECSNCRPAPKATCTAS